MKSETIKAIEDALREIEKSATHPEQLDTSLRNRLIVLATQIRDALAQEQAEVAAPPLFAELTVEQNISQLYAAGQLLEARVRALEEWQPVPPNFGSPETPEEADEMIDTAIALEEKP